MPDEVTSPKPEQSFEGIAVAPGIVSGKVYVHWTDEDEIPIRKISDEEIPEEIARFETALISTRAELLEIQQRISASIGSKDASIFDAHLLVVEDRTLIDEVLRNLERERVNVEYVFHQVAERYCKTLSEIEDDYLRERVVDIRDVSRRVIRNLLGKSPPGLGEQQSPHILVAHDLTPSDTALTNRALVLGFATEVGSRTSHTAIMARSMQIPAVVGVHGLCEGLTTGDFVLIDGHSGTVILNPSEETVRRYEGIETQLEQVEEKLELLRETTATTTDGHHVVLSANIEMPDELGQVVDSGAEGVGLYRTEFLYLNRRTPPTEEEQYENYLLVAEKTQPHGAIIRTLDMGGDKSVECLHMEEEQNPFLGCRAIRYCLTHEEIFKPQLRAILRAAAAFDNIRLMYPMISSVDELLKANQILDTCKQELRDEGIEHRADIEVGIMIEIPAAALAADQLAEHVAFFSIGTNDLIQYTIAVDRVNERVAHLYDPFHPAILRLIKMTTDASHDAGIWTGICGELAGDITMTPLLLGMGVDELSVGTFALPRVKRAVQLLDMETCRRIADEALTSGHSDSIARRCGEVANQFYGDLIPSTN